MAGEPIVGNVRTRQVTITVLDIGIYEADASLGVTDEYVLVVNGHVIKRMSHGQAVRLGIVGTRSGSEY